MTTGYSSKQAAIDMGVFYCTGDYKKKETLKKLEGLSVSQVGDKIEGSEIYEIVNSKGKKVQIGVSPFRGNEWNLWLIDPETGFAIRT